MSKKEPTSKVMSGEFKDCYIHKATTDNLAYIDVYGERLYLTRQTVKSMEHLSLTNTTSSVDVIKGAVIAGTAGAIAASTPQMSNLVKVVWNDDETSIIKVDSDVYEALIIGMNTDVSVEDTKTVSENDLQKKQNENTSNLLMWIFIALAWFAIELFYQ